MMLTLTEKYINLFTDFGFKKIFGEEVNKDLLLDFLNELLYSEQGRIVNLTYLKNEHLSTTEIDRRAIFDIYCENEKGEKFIVELQKTKQAFFKDRTLYYSTFPIREQAKRADWNFELKHVYTIAILDFVFEQDKNEPEKYRYDIKLSDIETHQVFYDKLTFIYLEMPKFTKQLSELNTKFEKWLFAFKNLHKLDRLPSELQEKIFERLFELAELAKYTPAQIDAYEDSLKVYRDLQNSLDTAKDEGIEIGIEKGIQIGIDKGMEIGIEIGIEKGKLLGWDEAILNNSYVIASKMLKEGIDINIISNVTGLSVQDILKLKNEQDEKFLE